MRKFIYALLTIGVLTSMKSSKTCICPPEILSFESAAAEWTTPSSGGDYPPTFRWWHPIKRFVSRPGRSVYCAAGGAVAFLIRPHRLSGGIDARGNARDKTIPTIRCGFRKPQCSIRPRGDIDSSDGCDRDGSFDQFEPVPAVYGRYCRVDGPGSAVNSPGSYPVPDLFAEASL